MDPTLITFAGVAGVATNVATAIINRVNWSSRTKTAVAIGVALILTTVGIWIQVVPSAWPAIATALASIFGIGQAVYQPMKPALAKLELATTGKTSHTDDLDKIIATALTEANNDYYATTGYPTGRHAKPLTARPVGDTVEDLDDPTGPLTDPGD